MILLKNRFIALVLFLFVMAALPLSVVRCDRDDSSAGTRDSASPPSTAPVTQTLAAEQPDNQKKAICYAASLCREDFCDEALRAAVILANTNRDSWDENSFDSPEELKKRIHSVYSSEKELFYQNESKSIPVAPLSNGQTLSDDRYPYLTAVASPWDCLTKDYDENLSCVGVSMNGVNYLCTKGYSAEEALLYYLPGFSVSSGQIIQTVVR